VADRKQFLNDVNKIVIKIGTSSITKKNCADTKENCSIDPTFMESIAARVLSFESRGKK